MEEKKEMERFIFYIGKKPTEFNKRVLRIFEKVWGLHNFPSKLGSKKSVWNEWMVEVNIFGQLATWDRNILTVLVVMCHDECIRMEINPSNPQHMKLRFHEREGRKGNLMTTHPEMDDHIRLIRKGYP